MPIALLLAALLLGTLGAPAAPAKPGKLLDKGQDTSFPIAYARGFARNPKALLVRIKGNPAQPIEVRWQVTCRPRRKKVKAPAGEFMATPTQTRKLKKGVKKPSDCTVDVQAAYVDAGLDGRIAIELFARVRKR